MKNGTNGSADFVQKISKAVWLIHMGLDGLRRQGVPENR
jgi:hypothetical protein